jgi:hypothetical protein
MAPSREELLAALGLAAGELGEAESLAWPEPAVGEARGLDVRAFSQSILANLRVVPIGAGLLGAAGLHAFAAADASGLVKLVGSGPVAVRVGPSGEGRTFQRPDEPNVAWVDASRSGPFLVETRSGRLVLHLEGGQLHLQRVTSPVAPGPLAAIEEPAEGWMRSSRDAWLNAETERTLATPGAWSVCVAAGRHARLVDPAAYAAPKEIVEAQLRGEVLEWLAAPRRWVRSLEAEQVSTMSRLALAEVDRLREIAADLERSDPGTDAWRDGWRRLCHARDDVEGIRVLLAERGESRDLDARVAALDRAGRALRMSAPLARLGRDERLRRALLADPDAWWGWLG